jgi:hypothetical protein
MILQLIGICLCGFAGYRCMRAEGWERIVVLVAAQIGTACFIAGGVIK